MLRVRLLGPFGVDVDGRPVPPDAWARRDAAGLVKLLALRPGRRLHREQVMDLMWPNLSAPEAAPRLHKAAHYARRALGRPDSVVLRDDVVALLPGVPVVVDAEEFQRAAAGAFAAGTPAAAAAVLDRFPGEPLPAEVYVEWAAEPREHLAAVRRRLLAQAGRWREVVDLDALDEAAHLELIRQVARDGDRALVQFEHLDPVLRRELGTGPGPAAIRLRDELVAALRERGDLTAADEGRLDQEIRFRVSPLTESMALRAASNDENRVGIG